MTLRLIVVLFALFLIPSIVWAEPPAGYAFVSYNNGLRLAQQEHKPIFVYFGRYGCGWCAKTNKEAFSHAALHKAYADHFVLVYVDTESGKRLTLPSGENITEMELGVRFKVFATPLFAYLEPDGKVIFKIAGIQSAKDFENYDHFVTDGHYKLQNIREFLARHS